MRNFTVVIVKPVIISFFIHHFRSFYFLVLIIVMHWYGNKSDSNSKPDSVSWLSQLLTCSGLRPIRMDRTLEKKLARSGLRGGSFWRKPYSFISSFSSSPSLSLIWLTSDVSSSHDMLGYLEENKSNLLDFYPPIHRLLWVYCPNPRSELLVDPKHRSEGASKNEWYWHIMLHFSSTDFHESDQLRMPNKML